MNVKTEEAVFFAHHGVLTVNGTFLTEAHVTAQLSPQKRATASFWASELDPNNFGWRVVNGTCVGRAFHFGNRGKKDCFDLKMAMGYSSATFELGNWTVTVKGMPSCDTGHDCLIKGPAHRIDVSFTARGNAPARDKPHGLIGQSFATPGLVRNGKQDVYPFAGAYTTTAQAEGAIEGTASEYEMQSAFATEFAFSRFNAAKDDRPSVEGSKATDIVDASSIERVADPSTEGNRRRLSEAPCPPPPAASPPPAPPSPCSPPAYDVQLPLGAAGVSAFYADLGPGTCTNDKIVAACAAEGRKPLCEGPKYHTSGGGQCLHPAQDTYRNADDPYWSSDGVPSKLFTLWGHRRDLGFPDGDDSFHGVCMYAKGHGARNPLKQHDCSHSFGNEHNDKTFITYCQDTSRNENPNPNPTGNDMIACKPESEGGMGCWKTLCIEEGSDGGPVLLPAGAGTPGKPASGSGCK